MKKLFLIFTFLISFHCLGNSNGLLYQKVDKLDVELAIQDILRVYQDECTITLEEYKSDKRTTASFKCRSDYSLVHNITWVDATTKEFMKLIDDQRKIVLVRKIKLSYN